MPTGVDASAVDWSRVQGCTYRVDHRMSYDYPTPIEDLRHHLVVFPPPQHGDQRRLSYGLVVSDAAHQETARKDVFGNLVVDLSVARVEKAIGFAAWTAVERKAGAGPHRVDGSWLCDPRFLEPSRLTLPDDRLRMVLAALRNDGGGGEGMAEEINHWVYTNMVYAPGLTDVHTTAAQALALGKGVCQDYAHVMIALCRLAGLPARYISGHLVGEGAMHAWVEVLLPCSGRPGQAVAVAFDPTHGRRPSLSYLTVATGRDFADVSPTRGSFRAASGGRLTSGQTVSLTAIRYRDGDLID
ncbi:MAG: transglutaminase family protein [Candidatus Dormibacteria bacterium]